MAQFQATEAQRAALLGGLSFPDAVDEALRKYVHEAVKQAKEAGMADSEAEAAGRAVLADLRGAVYI